MPKKLHKSLKIYFSKQLKRIPRSLPNPQTKSFLLACKYPKTTPSFGLDRHVGNDAAAATLSDVDRFLSDNFRSLFVDDNNDDVVKTPMTSSSLESAEESAVAVTIFTRDPCEEFRRSMEDAMTGEGHVEGGGTLDWDFMGEVLFEYLEMNDRRLHRFILKAFADLSVSLGRRRSLLSRTKD